jgi:hypothetical protein
MRENLVILLFVISLSLVGIAGCVDTTTNDTLPIQTPATTQPESSIELPLSPKFTVAPISFEKRYRPDDSCFWKADMQVTNIGDADAFDVVIHSLFIDDETSEMKTETEYYPRFNANESKIFTEYFDGACSGTYHLEFEVDWSKK